MPVSKKQGERLAGMLLIGLLMLNYPLLSIFSRPLLWFGIPALYVYLFVFWALFIGLAALVLEKRESSDPAMKSSIQGDMD